MQPSSMQSKSLFLDKVEHENQLKKMGEKESEIIDLNMNTKSPISQTNRANLMRNVQINSIISSNQLDQKQLNDDENSLQDISSISLFSNSLLTPSSEIMSEDGSNSVLDSSVYLAKVSQFNTALTLQSKSHLTKPTKVHKSTISNESILKKIKTAIKELQTVYDNRRKVAKTGKQYRLINDLQSASKSTKKPIKTFTNWIIVNEEEQINYWRNWNKNQQSAVILMDENILINSDDIFYNHYSKLFSTHEGRVAFFWGKYRKHAAIVKRIVMDRKQFDQESLWINIVKKVSNEIMQTRSGNPFPDYCPFAKVFEIYQQNCKQGTCLFVFMEVLTNKSLHYHIKQRRTIRVDELRRWAAQILNAIAYLQNRSIIHR